MRTLIHLAPRAPAGPAFFRRFDAVAAEIAARATAGGARVGTLRRLPEDPMGPNTPYQATLEISGDAATPDLVKEWVDGLGGRLDDVAHADLCTLLHGTDRVFVPAPPEPTPLRYQYLMRRNAAFSHDAYLTRYAEGHSGFGIAAPGKRGYVQFHVDPETSRPLANAAGLGIWGFDSIAELHLDSMKTWFDAMRESGFGPEAIADEEIFVDRARSWDFISSVDGAAGKAIHEG